MSFPHSLCFLIIIMLEIFITTSSKALYNPKTNELYIDGILFNIEDSD